MSKKSFVLVTLIICVFVIVLCKYVNDEDNQYEENLNVNNTENYNLAITLDGQKVNNFPDKGMYRVDVSCENADGKWDYDNWKLSIKNVVNTATCDVDFTTIGKTYFNNYLISLAGTNQGDGQIVNESTNYAIPNFSNASTLTRSQYVSYSRYYSESSSATSGISANSAFTFSGTSWRTNPNNTQSGYYYYFTFNIPSTGHYEFCMSIAAGNEAPVSLQINSNAVHSFYGDTVDTSGCTYIGNLTSSDKITVRIQTISTSYLDSQMSFYLRRTTATKTAKVGYRYEGSNPNNYVLFNNELWRIIGVVDESSHGVSGQQLVKLVRNDSLNGIVSKSSQNDYNNSSLKTILNNYYYNMQDATSTDYCYSYYWGSLSTDDIKGNCNYTVDGINSTYRQMIQSATWYQGGINSDTANITEAFQNERELAADGLHDRETLNTKIGLLYYSDYLYGALASDCSRSTLISNYFNSSSCGGKNWLSSKSFLLTITPYIDHVNNMYSINGSDWPNAGGFMVYPALYLNSSVYVLDGDGSITDPYIIGM